MPKISFGSFSSQACKREPGGTGPTSSGSEPSRCSPPTDPRLASNRTQSHVNSRLQVNGTKKMVLQQLGNVAGPVREEDPFTGVEKDHALPVLEMETQCIMWYVVVYFYMYFIYRISIAAVNISASAVKIKKKKNLIAEHSDLIIRFRAPSFFLLSLFDL